MGIPPIYESKVPDSRGRDRETTCSCSGSRRSVQLKAGHHRPDSETLFKWRLAGKPIMAQHRILAGRDQG